MGDKIKPVHVDWLVDGEDYTKEFPVKRILSAPGKVTRWDLAYAYDEAIRFAFDLEEKGIKVVYVGWSL